MNRVIANTLIMLFILMIIAASAQAGKSMATPGDVAGTLGALTGYFLLIVGLFYSVRWRMKIAGRKYKLGRQTFAVLLFWYSAFAAVIGIVAVWLRFERRADSSSERVCFLYGPARLTFAGAGCAAYVEKSWRSQSLRCDVCLRLWPIRTVRAAAHSVSKLDS